MKLDEALSRANSAVENIVVHGETVLRQRKRADGLGWRLCDTDPRTGRQPEVTFWGTAAQSQRTLDKLAADAAAAAAPTVARSKSMTLGQWVDQWLDRYSYRVQPSSNAAHPGVLRPYSKTKKAASACDTYLLPALGADTKLRAISHDVL